MSNSKSVTDTRRRLKNGLLQAFDSECGICHYNKCPAALEFHHLDPNEKEFTFGSLSTRSFSFLCEEAKKCVLLCSICHREVHADLAQIPQDIKRFDINKIQYRPYESMRK